MQALGDHAVADVVLVFLLIFSIENEIEKNGTALRESQRVDNQ